MLKRHYRIVIAMVLVGLVLAEAMLLTQHRTATATALVEVTPISDDPFKADKAASTIIDAGTEQTLASSYAVARKVAAVLPGQQSTTEVRSATTAVLVTGSTIMRIKYTAADAAEARSGADAVSKAYLDYRSSQALSSQTSIVDNLQRRREQLRRELEGINRTIAGGRPGSAAVTYAQSQRQVVLVELNSVFSTLNGVAGVDTSGGSIVSPASSSYTVVSPSVKTYLATGGLVGLLLGLALAFVRSATDPRVRDAYDAAKAGSGPIMGRLTTAESTVPATGADLDALRVIRERVLARLDDDASVVALLDETGREAPDYLGVSLAVAIEETGRNVVVRMPGHQEHEFDEVVARLGGSLDGSTGGQHATTPHIPGLLLRRGLQGQPPRRSSAHDSANGWNAPVSAGPVTLVVVSPAAPTSAKLEAARASDVVLVVAAAGRLRKARLAQVVRDLGTVGASLDGLVLVNRRRKLAGESRRWDADPQPSQLEDESAQPDVGPSRGERVDRR